MDLKYIILYSLLIVISIWDLKTHKIKNFFTFVGALLGIGVSIYTQHWEGFKNSLSSMLILFILLVIVWMILEIINMPAIGGGDIKLYVVISAFLGLSNAIQVVYFSILIGSLLFLLTMSPHKIKKMFDDFIYLFFFFIPNQQEKNLKHIAFSIPITIAVIINQIL